MLFIDLEPSSHGLSHRNSEWMSHGYVTSYYRSHPNGLADALDLNHGDECRQVKKCVTQSQSWQKWMWTLQWRHMIIITTATRSFVPQFVQVYKKGNTKAPHNGPFARGTTDGGIFPPQEPVMRKAFLCRNVFMLTEIDVEYNACLMFKHTPSSKMICVYIIGIVHWIRIL